VIRRAFEALRSVFAAPVHHSEHTPTPRRLEPHSGWRLSRRAVVGVGGWSLAAASAAVLGLLLDRHGHLARPRLVTVPDDTAEGVTFVDDVILVKAGGTVRALSARCPHLGCTISRVSGNLLVCPCHGSTFHLDGSVVTGPAPRPLRELPQVRDPRNGATVVHVT
jgi:nitrite reductase/ring-hydroxylating ferredoxin subunit